MEEMIRESIEQGMMVAKVTNAMMTEEFCDSIAVAKKRMFDAYVKAGFTQTEAIKLMVNDSITASK